MNAKPQRQEKIIEFLSTNRNGTFQEIFKSCKMGRGALAMGLKELLDEDVIKKDEMKYTIQNKPAKNKKIKVVEDNKLMNYDLEECMTALGNEKMPFETGYTLLRTAMFSLPKLMLELNSTKLPKSERDSLQEIITRYNQTIRRTFEVLYDIDPIQTSILKDGLEKSLTDPQFEKKMSGLATKKHKNRSKKI